MNVTSFVETSNIGNNSDKTFLTANYVLLIGTGMFGSLGISANFVLMCLIIPSFSKRKPYEWIIFNSALTDFILCLNGTFLQLPFSIIENPVLCNAAGFIGTFVMIVSYLSIPNIPFNRYISLYHHSKYDTIFTGKNIFVFFLLEWMFCLLPGFYPFAKGNYGLNEDTGFCSIVIKAHSFEENANIIIGLLIITTNSVAVYCTYKVVCKIRNHKSSLNSNVQSQLMEESRQLITVVILLLLIPTVTQLPAYLVMFIQQRVEVNPWISRTLLAPYLFTSAFNPYLTMFAIKQYRYKIKSWLKMNGNQVQLFSK